MSDDTPTRRFDSPDEEPPTGQTPEGAPPADPPSPDSDPMSWLLSEQGATDPDDVATTVAPVAGAAGVAAAGAGAAAAAEPAPYDPFTDILSPYASTDGAGGAAAGAGAAGAAAGASAAGAYPPPAETVRFDQLPPDGGGGVPPTPPSEGPSRGVIIGLAIAGGVLLIAIVVLLIVVFTSANGNTPTPIDTSTKPPTPSASSTAPTPTPSVTTPPPTSPPPTTPPPTTPPPPAKPTIAVQADPPIAPCEDDTSILNITLNYVATNVTSVSFGEASSQNAQGSFPASYDCAQPSIKYDLVATGNGGSTTGSVTVTREAADG